MDIYTILSDLGIGYEKIKHPILHTCDDAAKVFGDLSVGGHTKNLFLRNAKGDKHFLISVQASKRADLKKIGEHLGEKLGFGSPERLEKYLKSIPGTVSLMALINDPAHDVKVLIDDDLMQCETVLCHPPSDNTATLEIKKDDLLKFLNYVGHDVEYIAI